VKAHNGALPDAERLRAARALHHWWGVDRERLHGAGFRFSQEQLSADRYDPIIDEVAVSRALAGEPEVYASLTYYERLAVRHQIRHMMDAPDRDGLVLTEWVQTVGEDENAVRRFLQRERLRDRKAAVNG
jgi:hypothetical protein